MVSRCVVSVWPLHERVEALTLLVNTPSAILTLIEYDNESLSRTRICKRTAEYGFRIDPETFNAIMYGAIQNKVTPLAEGFTHVELHNFAVLVERVLMAAVLVLFGGAVAGGLLAPLTWLEGLIGVALLVVIRPVAGILSFVGTAATWPERAVIAFFGIRGIGSFYYLSHALAESSFQEMELIIAAPQLWAFVGFVVLTSIILHGICSSPVMDALDRRQRRDQKSRSPTDS